MSKIGADDFIVKTRATRETFAALPRMDLLPSIHLTDIEHAAFVGRIVRTDIAIGGVGEAFQVPKVWTGNCGFDDCEVCPATVKLAEGKDLLRLCRMSDDQLHGFMRKRAGCRCKSKITVKAYATVTELLALPAATPDVEGVERDYRDKVVSYLGTLTKSAVRYRATGEVIAEPRRQRASLLITHLERIHSAADGFALTPALREQFRIFQSPDASLAATQQQITRLVRDLTDHVTRIFGPHREQVLLTELAAYHSLAVIPWRGEPIKGVLDVLVVGDSGQGKSTQVRRLREAVHLGHHTYGSTSSRTGILYHLDAKVNDRRILRFGAFPLAHGELLIVDEAQNIPREEWREFTAARSEGVLKIDRSIRAEHPCRVRLLCFANPYVSRPMAQMQYGIMAVHPEQSFLDPQDLRRFDAVICVSESDRETDDSATSTPAGPPLVPLEVLRQSILWAWTRKVEHCRYRANVADAIKVVGRHLRERFGTPEIPLLITDAHEKVARLAFAFAALLHSTDEHHEQVIVTHVHVRLAQHLLETIYTHPNSALDQYAAVLRQRSGLTEDEYHAIKADLVTRGSNREDVYATLEVLDLFITEEELSRSDLESGSGLGSDALSARIRKLRKHRLIQSGKRGYRKTARFVAFLKRYAEERHQPKPPKPSNPRGKNSTGGVSP